MAARGKTIALWSAGLGVLVLLGAAVALRERIVEEWHIHKLRTGDPEEARRAAEALGRMGSVRAVPALLEAPGRSRKELPGTGRAGLYSLKIVESDAGFQPTLPFPAPGQAALRVAVLEPSGNQGAWILWDARTGNKAISGTSGTDWALQTLGWADAALAQIGERAVPALERAAADERLDAGTRAFATFELARRAMANPRIVLEEGGAEFILKRHTSMALPGSRGSVYLSADEFQRKTVLVWVTPSIGAPLLEEHPLSQGKDVSFSLGGKGYILRLEDVLFATERAVFTIRKRPGE